MMITPALRGVIANQGANLGCVLGPTWSAATVLGGTRSNRTMAYGNGLFVIGGLDGSNTVTQSSADGVTWTNGASSLALGAFPAYVAFGNGIFVANYNAVQSGTSTDGITWTLRSHSSLLQNPVWFANGKFYIFGQGNYLSSADGISYSGGSLPRSDSSALGGVYGGTLYVSITNVGSFVSSNGTSWAIESSKPATWTPSALQNCIAYGAGIFVVVGNFGINKNVATSTDGANWTERTTPSLGGDYKAVIYAQGVFLACGTSSSSLATSVDGINWTVTTTPNIFTSSGGFNLLCTNGAGAYVALGAGTATLANVGAC
jgi:hypothetical protein